MKSKIMMRSSLAWIAGLRAPVAAEIMNEVAIVPAGHARLLQCRRRLPWLAILILGLGGILAPLSSEAGTTNYFVRGVLKGVNPEEHQLIIAHEAIPNFMNAMTMPFRVKDVSILASVATGRPVTFQLHITETESWVDHVEQADAPQYTTSGLAALPGSGLHFGVKTNITEAGRAQNPLRTYKFTNELGQPVSLSDFRGQAVALTFFFTRCPLPEFCPRLSRNFQEAQRKLEAMENGPTNWHLLSISFDSDHDTPEVLKAYGKAYQYDPSHWSFLTGPKDKIAELARLCDVKFQADNGSFNHNFRTLIIDASNHLQMVFPISGDLSGSIVQELLKAAGGTNQAVESATDYARSESDDKF
jgi:protein SCO1